MNFVEIGDAVINVEDIAAIFISPEADYPHSDRAIVIGYRVTVKGKAEAKYNTLYTIGYKTKEEARSTLEKIKSFIESVSGAKIKKIV